MIFLIVYEKFDINFTLPNSKVVTLLGIAFPSVLFSTFVSSVSTGDRIFLAIRNNKLNLGIFVSEFLFLIHLDLL